MTRAYARTRAVAVLALLLAGCAPTPPGAEEIVALERAALDRWGRGDPAGYLELYAEDVAYFDPQRPRRVDGLAAMTELLEPIAGLVAVDRYEMIEPRVQVHGDAAVLTFNLESHPRAAEGVPPVIRWNTTAVYARQDGRWRLSHHHWSLTAAAPASPGSP